MNTFNCTATTGDNQPSNEEHVVLFTVHAYTQAFAEQLASDYVTLRLPGQHLDSVIVSHDNLDADGWAPVPMYPYDNDPSYDG